MKIPKKGVQCLSIILINSAFKIDKHYYPLIFLEDCKYAEKQNRMSNSIDEDTDISSDESDEEVSDEEVSDKE